MGNMQVGGGGSQLPQGYGTDQANAAKKLTFGGRIARLFQGNNKSSEVANKTLEKPQAESKTPITAFRNFKRIVQAAATSILQKITSKKQEATPEAAAKKEQISLDDHPKGMQEFLNSLSSLQHVTNKYLANEKVKTLDKAIQIVTSNEFEKLTPLEQVACKANILEACRNSDALLLSKEGTFGDQSVPVHIEEKMAELTTTLLGHAVPVPPETKDMKMILDVAVVDLLMKGHDLQPEKLQLGAPLRGNIATCPGTMKLASMLKDECANRGVGELFTTSSNNPVGSILSGLIEKFQQTPSESLKIMGSQLYEAAKTIQAKQENAQTKESVISDARTFVTVLFILRSVVPLITEKSAELSKTNAAESKRINSELQELKNQQQQAASTPAALKDINDKIQQKNGQLEELNKEVKELAKLGGAVAKLANTAQSHPEELTDDQRMLVDQLTNLILPQSK